MSEHAPDNFSSDRLDGSDRSDGSSSSGKFRRLRPSGGYRGLQSFGAATIVYDATVAFCERFLDRRSRTVDQMVQAARSGRQNIAEGSRASGVSSQTELRLVSVARASLDELLLDYEDFLRQRRLPQWAKDSTEALAVRKVGHRTDRSDQTNRSDYASWLDHREPAVIANAIICVIHQANYLLDRQIHALERDFIAEGGYTEQLAAARLAHRRGQDPTDQTNRSNAPPPACPHCGKPMALRTAHQGRHAGKQFWGCTGYPQCKGVRQLDPPG